MNPVPTVLAFDTTASDYGTIPLNAPAVMPYMDRRFANLGAAFARFPNLRQTGMFATITAGTADADYIDWEPGNADPPPHGWWSQQNGFGRVRPGFYADESDMLGTIIPDLGPHLGLPGFAGPSRPWRMWVAHPTGIEHICGPDTCGFPYYADGTQFWWSSIQGRYPGTTGDADVSLMRLDSFVRTQVSPPPPLEDAMAITSYVTHGGRVGLAVEKQDGSVHHIEQQNPSDEKGVSAEWWKKADGSYNWIPLGKP